MRPFLTTLSLLVIASQTHATVSPCGTDNLMRDAVMVVQIVDQDVTQIGNNICRVSGTIAVTHRGDVEIGRNLTADFNCLLDASQVGIGGSVYANPEAVRSAGALEVHITAEGSIAAYGAGLIGLDAPTHMIAWEPYCS